MYAWFLWDFNIPVILFSFIVTFIFIVVHKEYCQNNIKLLVPLFILLIFELYTVRDEKIFSFISAILRAFIIGSVLFLNDDFKKKILSFITNSVAILLLISIVAWILFLIGVPLPHKYTTFQNGKYAYENYYFFLYNLKLQVFFLPRFSSVFPEPGNLAIVTIALILANNFKVNNWSGLILLMATFLSFSLAGYVLLLIAFIMHVIFFSKKPLRNSFFTLLAISVFVVFFKTYQSGQNPVNMLILERLKFEDNGIAGNNRTTFIFDEYFNKIVHSSDIITGIGAKAFASMYGVFGRGVAGIKVFMVMHGILGVLLILLLYSIILIFYPTKSGLITVLTYFLFFYQNTYPLAEIFLIPLILSFPLYLKRKFELHEKNKGSLYYSKRGPLGG
ncbi:MAG: hypothetical protein ACP5PZ_04190 [Bacteroidales bacterium]